MPTFAAPESPDANPVPRGGRRIQQADEGRGGAVTLIQRFGSAANINALPGAGWGVPQPRRGKPDLHRSECAHVRGTARAAAHRLARLMKMSTRQGVLVQDRGQAWLAEPQGDGKDARTLRPLPAAAAGGATAPARASTGRHRGGGRSPIRSRDGSGHEPDAWAQAAIRIVGRIGIVGAGRQHAEHRLGSRLEVGAKVA